MERRLAAILAADVVGYSRLMEADEEATLTTLSLYRRFIDGRVAEHHGRVFGGAGDSVIAEFASPVEAVRCAVEIQHELESRNTELTADRRMQFRVGINLGDVVVEGENLHGDGVNIAARLEELADPGGICVSGTAYDHLAGKLDLKLDDLGEQQLKNISRPVRVWRWIVGEPVTAEIATSQEPLPLPEKPSIAVLPFDNMSGDPEQEYFADGLAEDIITELSRFHWFFVIARNTSFTYKGKSVDVAQVGHELGVRYVLEGSVRRAGGRIRVTAQLIEAASGHHVWAERYDRDISDIFALQDEITERIVGAVGPEFLAAEARKSERKPPDSLDVWESIVRGNRSLWRLSSEGMAEARVNFDRAIMLDPDSADALAGKAMTVAFQALYGASGPLDTGVAEAMALSAKAVSLYPDNAWAHASNGLIEILRHRPETALLALRQAIDINPNMALAHAFLGMTLSFEGKHGAALSEVDVALRLSPRDPARGLWMRVYSAEAFHARRYDDAVEWTRKSLEASPGTSAGLATLAASLAHLGRLKEARECVAEMLRQSPDVTLSHIRSFPIKDAEYLERLIDGLAKAGLPE